MDYVSKYLSEVKAIADSIDKNVINRMIDILVETREKHGRVFFLGVGGSAANCTHAVNDFRKLVFMEAYSPVDNVAELTARTNDEGWHTVFSEYLKISNLRKEDVVFVLSVGGGSREKQVSVNLVEAMDVAKERGAKIVGIIGRDGGHCAKVGDAVCIIPTQSSDTITPHAEAWQGVIWHLMASDPRLKSMTNKWESLEK